jgi:hypothetical protein
VPWCAERTDCRPPNHACSQGCGAALRNAADARRWAAHRTTRERFFSAGRIIHLSLIQASNGVSAGERAEWLKKMRAQAEALYDHLAPAYWVKFGLYANAAHRQFIEMFLHQYRRPLSLGLETWPGPRALGRRHLPARRVAPRRQL